MIIDWAEHGTLRDLYCNYKKITWEAKISIARDICCGLAYLHSVSILHHDLRCENILIAEKMQPKISNFNFAHVTCCKIEDNVVIHWLAPEKLKGIGQTDNREFTRYTTQCEIFSFGMLLWELCFHKIPYEDKSITIILNYVVNGGRETLDFKPNSNSIQKNIQMKYRSIIKLAWEQQEPSLRPGIQQIFNMLQDLYENHVLKKKKIGKTDVCALLTSFDEGIRADKAGNYEKTWKCFEEHASFGS